MKYPALIHLRAVCQSRGFVFCCVIQWNFWDIGSLESRCFQRNRFGYWKSIRTMFPTILAKLYSMHISASLYMRPIASAKNATSIGSTWLDRHTATCSSGDPAFPILFTAITE